MFLSDILLQRKVFASPIMANASIGRLEEEARKRKERLRALREQKTEADASMKKGKFDLPKPELKLRNYTPADENLQKAKLEDAKPGVVEEHIQVSIILFIIRLSIIIDVL